MSLYCHADDRLNPTNIAGQKISRTKKMATRMIRMIWVSMSPPTSIQEYSHIHHNLMALLNFRITWVINDVPVKIQSGQVGEHHYIIQAHHNCYLIGLPHYNILDNILYNI